MIAAHVIRGLVALAVFLVALPLLAPALSAHVKLASPSGHCRGPEGMIAETISGVALIEYMGRCAADIDATPDSRYELQPYSRTRLLPIQPEAGLAVLPPAYYWVEGRSRLFTASPITGNLAAAGGALLWLLALAVVMVVALRPR